MGCICYEKNNDEKIKNIFGRVIVKKSEKG